MDPKDIELIRELNKSEEFTILKLNKPYTLAIRQYNTQQVVIRNKKEQEDFLKRFKDASTFRKANAGGPDWSDFAANSAHNLCEAFRKSGLPETYVLHSKYASFVTVGAYDGVRDPRLQQMQDFLESRFRMEAYRPYELFPTPQVMVVPR
jgi:hypothetical protein